MTVATAISRITGFARVLVVAGAMGTTFLANTYQSANTAPNVVFELVAAGVLTSVFVPTFMEYLVRGDRRESWRVANVLTTLALFGLAVLSLLLIVIAPWIMRLLTLGVQDPDLRAREIALGATWLRLFAPQVAFYGLGMIMTGALHANRRFGLPAVAPIFNNVVVIAVYLIYAMMRGSRPPSLGGITDAEVFVLGAGTTLGVIAMTLCLVPSLRSLGWRFRFSWQPRHPAVKKAARLGAWALGYAGGYQAGLFVVLLLANRVRGGVAAYQWAFTFFFVPHALFAVPIFNVLFPVMAEHVVRGKESELVQRLRDGLSMLVFILVPIALWLVASAEPLARISLEYGVMDRRGAELVARVIAAFAIGLPTYSAFLVYTRAFYAFGDTKTPTLVNALVIAVSSAIGAALFFVAPARWSVAALALTHSLGFAAGTGLLARLIGRRFVTMESTQLVAAATRAVAFGTLALAAMLAVRAGLPEHSKVDALVSLIALACTGGVVYLGAMAKARSPELARAIALVKRRG